jgi:predicted transposase YdaD
MHDHNYTLKFQQKRWWQFLEERSNGSLGSKGREQQRKEGREQPFCSN